MLLGRVNVSIVCVLDVWDDVIQLDVSVEYGVGLIELMDNNWWIVNRGEVVVIGWCIIMLYVFWCLRLLNAIPWNKCCWERGILVVMVVWLGDMLMFIANSGWIEVWKNRHDVVVSIRRNVVNVTCNWFEATIVKLCLKKLCTEN